MLRSLRHRLQYWQQPLPVWLPHLSVRCFHTIWWNACVDSLWQVACWRWMLQKLCQLTSFWYLFMSSPCVDSLVNLLNPSWDTSCFRKPMRRLFYEGFLYWCSSQTNNHSDQSDSFGYYWSFNIWNLWLCNDSAHILWDIFHFCLKPFIEGLISWFYHSWCSSYEAIILGIFHHKHA